jgi:hypothetical protein
MGSYESQYVMADEDAQDLAKICDQYHDYLHGLMLFHYAKGHLEIAQGIAKFLASKNSDEFDEWLQTVLQAAEPRSKCSTSKSLD